jgi:hypothetical protein
VLGNRHLDSHSDDLGDSESEQHIRHPLVDVFARARVGFTLRHVISSS